MSFPIKLDLAKVTLILGVWIPLWSGIAYIIDYDKSLAKQIELDAVKAELALMENTLAKQADINLMKLDSKIGQTEIKVLIYAKDYPNLKQGEKDAYERLKRDLTNLENQRNNILFGNGLSN